MVVVETVGVGQSETDVEEVCDTVAVVVQPASGDVLQFLKAGIMEVPDVLVVTKADLGDAAKRARADLDQALAALGSRDVPVRGGVVGRAAERDRRAGRRARRRTASGSTWPARRLRARRLSALREFAAEHGESALRSLGGRREAQRLLDERDSGESVAELVAALEEAGR